MSIHEKHIHRIELVNRAVTVEEHNIRQRELTAWREGVEATGRKFDLCACDMHYLNQGIDRPMCCGVWLDWSETPTPPTP